MIVKQIWTNNDFRNFNYIIACPSTGEALAIDPLDYNKCLSVSKNNGFEITQILNTHHHHDHIGGNSDIIRQTGAKLLAHAEAKNDIPDIDIGLSAGDTVSVGKLVDLEVLDTPGHTMSHVCLLSHTDQPALFCGDTLFNAGAGHCKGGGHPGSLYSTFNQQLSKLPDDTLIYPGHDYIENNLNFTLDREPDNKGAKTLKTKIQGQDTNDPLVTTMELEKQINTFFRLNSATVRNQLSEKFPELGANPSEKDVFLKLRELRNSW